MYCIVVVMLVVVVMLIVVVMLVTLVNESLMSLRSPSSLILSLFVDEPEV